MVLDEVFTGCWRLGVPRGGALLGVVPDVAVYGKLLTGGAGPLAVTLASRPVFEAFGGEDKLAALLHGHSFTAYPAGCAAAAAALRLLGDAAHNPNLCAPRGAGTTAGHGCCVAAAAGRPACASPCGRLSPLWDEASAATLSTHPRVRGVTVIGTVLALELAPPPARTAASHVAASYETSGSGRQDHASASEECGGYASAAAADVVAALRVRGVAARPLGPVVYMMASPTSQRQTCDWLLGVLADVLDESHDAWQARRGEYGSAPYII